MQIVKRFLPPWCERWNGRIPVFVEVPWKGNRTRTAFVVVCIFFLHSLVCLTWKTNRKLSEGKKWVQSAFRTFSTTYTKVQPSVTLLHSDLTSNVSNVCSHYMFRTLLSGHRCSDHTGPVCQRCVLVSFVLFANVTKVVIAMVNTLVLFD